MRVVSRKVLQIWVRSMRLGTNIHCFLLGQIFQGGTSKTHVLMMSVLLFQNFSLDNLNKLYINQFKI